MKKIIIFGASNFSIAMRKYIQKYNKDWEIVGYTVEKEYMKNNIFDGFPIYPFEELKESFKVDEIEILLTVGYSDMMRIRENKYQTIKDAGYHMCDFIHPSAIMDSEKLGSANIILENVIVSPGSVIGNGNIIWGNVHIPHDAVIGDFNYFAPNSFLGGGATLTNNCFLGNGASVGSGKTLAPFTFVGMNASVNTNTDPYDVYVAPRSVKLEKNSLDMMKYF